MTKVVATGKTVEDAVEQGLAELRTSRERVNVTVLEQPSKGFLGWFGTRKAKVELTVIPEPDPIPAVKATIEHHPITASEAEVQSASTQLASTESSSIGAADPYEEAVRFIRETAAGMGLEVSVDVHHRKDESTLDISGPELGMLIGRRGQTLDALQYLTNIVANRYSDGYVRIILDAEHFRERRRKTLESLAERLAGQVVSSGKEVMLEPMSSAERKVIHARLQRNHQVRTYSKGDEPNRRVIIAKK